MSSELKDIYKKPLEDENIDQIRTTMRQWIESYLELGEQTKVEGPTAQDIVISRLIAYIDELRTKFLHVDMDLNWAEAVIDGSWPTSDEQIRIARERYKTAMSKVEEVK